MVKAIAVLKGDSSVTGVITFEQAQEGGPVTVTGSIQNLDPNAERGFHVHTYGDTSAGCNSCGAHFNPFGKNHGGPTAADRHVGDLGNVKTDAKGTANVDITGMQKASPLSSNHCPDSQISLVGPYSIVGRALVIHAGVDDLGLGGHPDSLKTGNAGGRAACGVIGLTE